MYIAERKNILDIPNNHEISPSWPNTGDGMNENLNDLRCWNYDSEHLRKEFMEVL